MLKIAQKFAGYSLGAADIMRKAMGKKIAYLMQEQQRQVHQRRPGEGLLSKEDAQKVFDLIEPFAGYAFNKAHSYSYGTIAYQTAWLKANYPEEYLTAVLMQADSHPAGTLERIAQAYNECVRLGIPVLPPDVNKQPASTSRWKTWPDGKIAIRFGLAMIKNVGAGCGRVDCRVARRGRRRLRLAGRLLSPAQHPQRQQARAGKPGQGRLPRLRRRHSGCTWRRCWSTSTASSSIAQSAMKLKETGQTTMFDLFGDEVATPLAGIDLESAPMPRAEVLAWEKELLGIWLSEHPFTHAAPQLAPLRHGAVQRDHARAAAASCPRRDATSSLPASSARQRRLTTRDGRGFIAAEVQDLSGALRSHGLARRLRRTPDLWLAGSIVLMQVRVRERGDRLTAGVQEAMRLHGGLPAAGLGYAGSDVATPAPGASSQW